MSRNWPALVSIMLLAIVLGAVREFLFINLNYVIDFVENHREVSYAHSSFRSIVDGCSLNELITLKWLFSFAFMLLMLALSIVMARVLFGDHRYRKALMLGFAVIGSLALTLHALGPAPLRIVALKLVHMLQYPVVLLFLAAASLLGEKERRSPKA